MCYIKSSAQHNIRFISLHILHVMVCTCNTHTGDKNIPHYNSPPTTPVGDSKILSFADDIIDTPKSPKSPATKSKLRKYQSLTSINTSPKSKPKSRNKRPKTPKTPKSPRKWPPVTTNASTDGKSPNSRPKTPKSRKSAQITRKYKSAIKLTRSGSVTEKYATNSNGKMAVEVVARDESSSASSNHSFTQVNIKAMTQSQSGSSRHRDSKSKSTSRSGREDSSVQSDITPNGSPKDNLDELGPISLVCKLTYMLRYTCICCLVDCCHLCGCAEHQAHKETETSRI